MRKRNRNANADVSSGMAVRLERKFDTLVVWRLDRLGRNLRHLILLLDEFQALGIAFVSLAEGIDATTPAGRLRCMFWPRLRSSSAAASRSG